MKRLALLFSAIIFSIFIVSGCGEDKNEKKDEAVETDTKQTPEGNTFDGYADLITYMESEIGGKANMIYENSEAQTHEMEGITVTLDSYVVAEVNDINEKYADSFDDETDGGVIIAHYTIKNELNNDAYYMPHPYMEIYGADQTYSNYYKLLPEEEQLTKKLSDENDYLIKAGETISGYYGYAFGKETLHKALDLSTVTVYIGEPHSEKGEEVASVFGKSGQFTLSINKEGDKKTSHNEAFYQDLVTIDDMGEKTMLKEKEGINLSEQFGDVTVTLDGYQFTEFVPNSRSEAEFESFENGIVLLTVKFLIDNGGQEDIGLASINSRVLIDGGAEYELSNGSLLDLGARDIVKAGDSGELLQIYTLDKEQYEKNWKNKTFEIKIGPIRDPEYKDLSNGKEATLKLPK